MLYPSTWKTYKLLDFGEGRKLERFGDVIVDRPEPSATGRKSSPDIWKKSFSRFREERGQKGSWGVEIDPFEINFQLNEQDFRFQLKQTAFKHLGIFPEQAVNWQFIADHCTRFRKNGVEPKILNLFAYTGAASIIAARFGASVTHVDSSKSVVQWARDNAELNNISNIRWIVEDARKFVERAIKRGEQYNGIILDPPIFGMVPKGKSWKLNSDLKPLMESIINILDTEHHFLILNTYSPQLPLKKLKQILNSISEFPKDYEATILGLKSTEGKELKLGNLIRFNS